MDLMRRHLIIASQPMEYSGIPVWKDNAYYSTGGRVPANSFISDPNWFITGYYDTGSTSSKSYRWLNVGRQTFDTALLFFNTLDGTTNAVDWWPSASGGSGQSTMTFNCAGQYILFSVYKPRAADIYLYCNTLARYIFKGNNV